MHRLLAVVVNAVSSTFAHEEAPPGQEVEITWRHWGHDDSDVWFMDVEFPSPEKCLQIARAACS